VFGAFITLVANVLFKETPFDARLFAIIFLESISKVGLSDSFYEIIYFISKYRLS